MPRFYLTDAPVMAPGSCRCCGSATKRPLVDMGYIEDMHGGVYYCAECIGEVCRLLDFISPEQARQADSTLKTALLHIQQLEDELNSLAPLRKILDDYRQTVNSTADVTVGSILAEPIISASPLVPASPEPIIVAESITPQGNVGFIEQASIEDLGTVRAGSISAGAVAKRLGTSKPGI